MICKIDRHVMGEDLVVLCVSGRLTGEAVNMLRALLEQEDRIGKALVDEALRRGVKKVYAGTRSPVQHSDKRVTPLTLDVTNVSQIQRAVGGVDTLDVLINSAGIAIYDDLSNLDVLEQTFAVNFLGLLRVTNAFLPLLKRSKGAILNNLSSFSKPYSRS